MSDLSVPNTFVTGGVVDADHFNANYSSIVSYVNARNSGSSTWDTMYCTHATNVPLTANNSSGTQDIAQFKDNGTTIASINDGGTANFPYQDFAYAVPSGQTVTSGATALVAFTSVSSQTHSSMSNVGKFTCQASGKYYVLNTLSLSGVGGAGTFEAYIYVNGSVVSKLRSTFQPSPIFHSPILFDVLSLSTNDYIETYVKNFGGVSMSVNSTNGSLYVFKLS